MILWFSLPDLSCKMRIKIYPIAIRKSTVNYSNIETHRFDPYIESSHNFHYEVLRWRKEVIPFDIRKISEYIADVLIKSSFLYILEYLNWVKIGENRYRINTVHIDRSSYFKGGLGHRFMIWIIGGNKASLNGHEYRDILQSQDFWIFYLYFTTCATWRELNSQLGSKMLQLLWIIILVWEIFSNGYCKMLILLLTVGYYLAPQFITLTMYLSVSRAGYHMFN